MTDTTGTADLVKRLRERARSMNGVLVGAGDGDTFVPAPYRLDDRKMDLEAADALEAAAGWQFRATAAETKLTDVLHERDALRDALEAAERERDELIEDVEARGVTMAAQDEALEAAERVIKRVARDYTIIHTDRANARDYLSRHATGQRKGGDDEQ